MSRHGASFATSRRGSYSKEYGVDLERVQVPRTKAARVFNKSRRRSHIDNDVLDLLTGESAP